VFCGFEPFLHVNVVSRGTRVVNYFISETDVGVTCVHWPEFGLDDPWFGLRYLAGERNREWHFM